MFRFLPAGVAVVFLTMLGTTSPALAQSATDLLEPSKKPGTGPAPTPGGGKAGVSTTGVFRDVSQAQITLILRSMGYPVQLATAKNGDPKIRTKSEGINITVDFYGCNRRLTPRRCKSLGMYSGFRMNSPISHARINNWNKRKRYARAYRYDAAGLRIYIEMDVPMQGATAQTFRNQFNMFLRQNRTFRQHIGFRLAN